MLVTPLQRDYRFTLNTLRYVSRRRKINNPLKSNAVEITTVQDPAPAAAIPDVPLPPLDSLDSLAGLSVFMLAVWFTEVLV